MNRVFLFVFSLAFGGWAGSSWAQTPGLVTYTMLAEACGSGRHEQQGYCEGYVMGVGDLMTLELGFRDDLQPACVSDREDWTSAYDTLSPQLSETLVAQRGFVRGHIEETWAVAFPCIPSQMGTQPRQSYFIDGLDLHARCGSERSRERGTCRGYLVAVFERLTVVSEGEEGCLPPGVTGSSLAQTISGRIRRITEEDALYAWLADSAVDMIRRVIEVTWSRPQDSCDLVIRS